MAQFTSAINSKLHQGTYRVVPKVDWTHLLQRDFGHPDWATLYPLNNKGQPVGMLTPRMACKLFHDGIYIIQKGDENPKFIQDRIPEVAHKCFKKKQWRKQFYEAMRRVCCRLAVGKGFRPNCVAEDVFIHAILNMSFELGWRRIEQHTANLPECDKDKDFSRVTRLGANEDIGNLLKGKDAAAAPATGAKKGGAASDSKLDVKSWFRCYEMSEDHLFDHIVKVSDEDCDNWSVNSGSTSGSSSEPRMRGDSNVSIEGINAVVSGSVGSPRKPRSNSNLSQNSVDHLFPHIGVPINRKPRSNSAISALSTDGLPEDGADTEAFAAQPDLSSLKFALEASP